MDGIGFWIHLEGTGHVFFLIYPLCLLLLLFLLKRNRSTFLFPSIIITIVVVNPLLNQFDVYAYWRFLWMIPVIPVLASVMPAISEKCHKGWIKGIAAFTGISLVVAGGTFLYSGTGGSFDVPANNIYKLPTQVISVADKLLSLKEKPRIIAEPSISVYIRQYTAKIDTLFGRNIYGYMDGYQPDAYTIITELENTESDLSKTRQLMLDEQYDYLVVNEQVHRDNIQEAFELIDQVGDYCIYCPLVSS